MVNIYTNNSAANNGGQELFGHRHVTKLTVGETLGLDACHPLLRNGALGDVEEDRDDCSCHEASHHARECAREDPDEKERNCDVDQDVVLEYATQVEF